MRVASVNDGPITLVLESPSVGGRVAARHERRIETNYCSQTRTQSTDIVCGSASGELRTTRSWRRAG